MVDPRRAAVLLIFLIAASALVEPAGRTARPADGRSSQTHDPCRRNASAFDSLDVSGFAAVAQILKPWRGDATLREIAREWQGVGHRGAAMIDAQLAVPRSSRNDQILLSSPSPRFNFTTARPSHPTKHSLACAPGRKRPAAARDLARTVMFFQGVSAMRRGENDNCIACRGESSCIVPISPAAVHTNPAGSRLAIKHFKEYLELFPDDVGVRWLLQIAHMTLGESSE